MGRCSSSDWHVRRVMQDMDLDEAQKEVAQHRIAY
jgi:hypothetical protein